MTGSSVIVDTNIFIDLMKGEISIAQRLESFNDVYLNPIVLSELYFGAYRSNSPAKHLNKITIAISNAKLLPMDGETSQMFINTKLALLAKGKPIPENDIWIAATARQYNLPLYTTDIHFKEIEGIQLL